MPTFDIGTKLVALIRAGKNAEAMETLYAPTIVSIEALAPPGGNREQTGIAACLAKGKQFRERHEIHSGAAEGPYPHGDRFAVVLSYDLTDKATGQRQKMNEVAVYTVKDDKIVREEFFYQM